MLMQKGNRLSTLADKFCDTYLIDEIGASYIKLNGIRADSRYIQNPELLLVPRANKQRLVVYDGILCYKVRTKYHNAIRSNGNSPEGIYYCLNQNFTEDAIKELFSDPNIWLLRTNAKAKRLRATEQSEYNRRKKMYGSDWDLHRECMMRTSNLSASKSARIERSLQFG